MQEAWDDDEWIEVFRQRGVWDLSVSNIADWRGANKQFFALVSRYIPDGARVLELGCGPGRHAISLAANGYRAVGIDQNPVIVRQAQRNATACGVEDRASFLVGDMDDLGGFIGQEFAAVTHGGVMEHLPSKQAIQASLAAQLTVAPLVVFDVPVGTDKNLRLFARDTIFRQEWPPDEWVGDVLAPFAVQEWHIESHDAPNMTDDLVLAIRA